MGRGARFVIALTGAALLLALAGTMAISLTDVEPDRSRHPAAVAACTETRDYPLLCEMPDPFTTRGEARWLRDLAAEHGWESVGIVTMTPHLARTRVSVERCWDGDVAYLDSDERLTPLMWAYQYAYQSAAFVKVARRRGC